MEIILQEYNIEIEGAGIFYVSNERKDRLMIPTFGFDEKGNVKNRKLGEKEGYASLKREWVDNCVKISVEEYIKNRKKKIVPGPRYAKDPYDYDVIEVEDNESCKKVYVFLFTCSNVPNEIGIAVDDISFIIEDSKVSFQKKMVVI